MQIDPSEKQFDLPPVPDRHTIISVGKHVLLVRLKKGSETMAWRHGFGTGISRNLLLFAVVLFFYGFFCLERDSQRDNAQ